MTLPAGTALQDGQYILDGIYREDALGLMYLATHVPTGQVVQVRCLHPKNNDSDVWDQLTEQITELGQQRHPHVIAPLTCFYEQGHVFVVMATGVGQPLSTLVTPAQPLTAQQSVAYVQQVAAGLNAISQAGPFTVDIGPAHVWCHLGNDQIVLAGLGLPPEMNTDPGEEVAQPALARAHQDIAALARLLHFCLTGEAVETTHAPDVCLKQCRPDLNEVYGNAIHCGLHSPPDQVETWLALLVSYGGTTPIPTPHRCQRQWPPHCLDPAGIQPCWLPQ
ncbi:hypothetical protein XM38_052040 [Halomicronema hongdechloris C2206]|uniref:Protein kinase domain-containing protein n=1 Tax=Halomicronema hongdechloris C2206 TaxID=1641165 RepID=A0A1Z3HVA6_9CYAN|nr:protein kinase [Halomicronema hongdechloris]ASC74229.1 hypothetical protein XM38_052040 [Halomicronema hongdechloris C2206]